MAVLDQIIHAPNRLQICAMLSATAELDFKLLREQLGVSDSVLSKQLKVLEKANYISTIKRTSLGRPCTWVSLTSTGRQAFESHISALKAIID